MMNIGYRKRRFTLLIITVSLIYSCIIITFVSAWYVLKPCRSITEKASGIDKIECVSTDGCTLVAQARYQSQSSHKWVILVHPYHADKTVMYPYADVYCRKGYNVLLPDNRAHGESGGKYIGMGYLDQFDILEWVYYIVNADPEAQIVLHGISMGAAAVMMLSGQNDLPDNIAVCVEDSGYTSAKDYLSWKLWKKFHLPELPILYLTNIGFKLLAGYYMNEASVLDVLRNCSIPLLFIHGTEDQTVLVDNAYRLYEAAGCSKELYIVEGAAHAACMETNPEDYWRAVFTFIHKHCESL